MYITYTFMYHVHDGTLKFNIEAFNVLIILSIVMCIHIKLLANY